MARTLSDTLTNQQKIGIISWPYLIAKIRRKWGGVIRYEFESLYAGSEYDYHHTACMPSDGSLIRLRVSEEDDLNRLYYQRITNPDENSDYSQWTYLNQWPCSLVASCAYGTNVSQFFLRLNKYLYWRHSEDCGETWSAWENIITDWPENSPGMDAAYKPNGDLALTFISHNIFPEHYDDEAPSVHLIYNPYCYGQSFTPQVDCTLDYIDLLLYRTGLPGTASAILWLGWPPDLQIASVQFDANELTASEDGEWKRIDLGHLALDADQVYTITLHAPFGEASERINWKYATGNPYSRGNVMVSSDGGYLWGPNYDEDFAFRVYVYKIPPGTPFLYCYFEENGAEWKLSENTAEEILNTTGISIFYHNDWNLIATYGGNDVEKGIKACIFGDGVKQPAGTWSPWTSLLSRESTEPFTYRAPCVRRPDTTRLYFIEAFTQEETQERLFYSHCPPSATFDDYAWLEPVPMNVQSQYGLAFCNLGSYAWLTNANKVYRALTTDEELDISAKLLLVDMRQYPDIRKGKTIITVDNTNAQYNTFARLGDELTIGIGYKTPAGNEYSLTSSFWVTKHKLVSPPWYPLRMLLPSGVIGTLVIEAEDAWDFLKRYKARRTYSWEAGDKSVKELLAYFLARAGLDFEVQSSSDAAENFKPKFEIARGTTYRTIVKNLMRMIPDQLIFREAKAIMRNPTTAEPADWIYHNMWGQALLLYRGRYGSSAWDPNRAEVWGDTLMKMDAEWPQVQKVRDRLSRVTTPTYPDLDRAGERALAELRRSEILTGEESYLIAPTNCGIEPWDKIKITDTVGGVSNIYRRVIRLKTYWSKKTWAYHQTFMLGAD